jgi:Bacterial regulatory proteins, tetR family
MDRQPWRDGLLRRAGRRPLLARRCSLGWWQRDRSRQLPDPKPGYLELNHSRAQLVKIRAGKTATRLNRIENSRRAEEVPGELSFVRGSVVEITRRAGVAHGTCYVHFPDKRAAFTEWCMSSTDRYATPSPRPSPRLYSLVREAEFVDIDIYREKVERRVRRYVAR